MDLQSILKALINSKGLTYKALGKRLGGKSVQSISDRLNKHGSMSVKMLILFLDALDCELIIRAKKQKEDIWVVTNTEPNVEVDN